MKPEDVCPIIDARLPGATDATAAIQSAINSGWCELERGKHYLIASGLALGASAVLSGNLDSAIVMKTGTGGFDNLDRLNKYAANCVGITSSNVASPRIGGFAVYTMGPEAITRPLVVRGCADAQIDDFEAYGFGFMYGSYVAFDSNPRMRARNLHVHNCGTNQTGWGQGALTAISLDCDRISLGGSGIPSADAQILDSCAHDITTGSAFATLYGDNADGFEVSGGNSTGGVLRNLRAWNVNEGLDLTGSNFVVTASTFRDMRSLGIKMMHGAQFNILQGIKVINAGWAGILLSGSATSQDTAYNLVDACHVVNPCTNPPSATRGGIITMPDPGVRACAYNRIQNCYVVGLGSMPYGLIENAHPGNEWLYNRVVGASSAPFWNVLGGRFVM